MTLRIGCFWIHTTLKCYIVFSDVSIAGVDKYTQFSCEAHNQKGVATSREANINIKGKAVSLSGC